MTTRGPAPPTTTSATPPRPVRSEGGGERGNGGRLILPSQAPQGWGRPVGGDRGGRLCPSGCYGEAENSQTPAEGEAEVMNLLSLQPAEAGCVRRRNILGVCLRASPPFLFKRVCGCRGGFPPAPRGFLLLGRFFALSPPPFTLRPSSRAGGRMKKLFVAVCRCLFVLPLPAVAQADEISPLVGVFNSSSPV